jgi:hypothetical protein
LSSIGQRRLSTCDISVAISLFFVKYLNLQEMATQNALPKTFGTCDFCSMDVADPYKCPKCRKSFCGLKCYRSTAHASCSDNFYKDQINQHLKRMEQQEVGLTVNSFLNVLLGNRQRR